GDKQNQVNAHDCDRKIGPNCADPGPPAATVGINRQSMTQEELISGAQAEHDEWVSIEAIAKPAPEGERLKFTHCQRVDVANSASVEMTRVSMMDSMATAPVVVGRQRQHAKDSTYPIVRQTIAKEGAMSAIM